MELIAMRMFDLKLKFVKNNATIFTVVDKFAY